MGRIRNFFKNNSASGVVGEGIKNIFGGLGSIIDDLHLSGEEKQAFKLAVEKQKLEAEKLAIKVQQIEADERNKARAMYSDDSSLQKFFAFSFLFGYFALLFVILLVVFGSKFASEFENWQIAFVSTIFGNMSMKVGTITDFLFGGSKGQADQTKEGMNKALENRQKPPAGPVG